MIDRGTTVAFFFLFCIVFFASPALAFGAGNIPTIARVEGQNFRHGDIEDTLKKLLFLKGAKWSSKLIKKVYFGNWLRDYSQAVDVGTVKSCNPQTIRILVWVLSFMSFGFATGEFEVTDERLGVYRPEEHIDNPKDYADNQDARLYDARLRPPVHPTELVVDPLTCMKNYIANETLGIATSSGYIKHSLNRSIHFGRLYTSGPPGDVNNEAHLNEALRCLGQALHTLEDFSAHSNYVELALRELGMLSIFPHTGTMTQMMLPNGKPVFPLTTGTFGGVDFLHSVLGEASDKFTQTELQEMDGVLAQAHEDNKKSGARHTQTSILKDLLSKIPNCAGLAAQADSLEQAADAKEMANLRIAHPDDYGSKAAQRKDGDFDPVKLSRDIYPILEFRDNAVKTIAAAIDSITESIPGFPEFTDLMDAISDQLSIYVFSVLSPYIRPIIQQAHMELKVGSTEVLNSAKNHQFEVWDNPHSTDPTHSMLSKDHFSNVLNAPAGQIASKVVEYVVPRVLFAWENVNADVGLILFDVIKVLHHPGLRDPNSEIQTSMFENVRVWADAFPGGHRALEMMLNSDAVRAGKNHKGGIVGGDCGHGKLKGGEWDKAEKVKDKKKGGKDKKKDEHIKIGGMKIPTGGAAGLLGGGALGSIAGAALAGYTGGSFPGEEKKEKSKDKDKEKKDKKDKDEKEKDKYGSVKEKKDKEEKDKYGSVKEKKDKEEKDKYGSVRDKKKDKDYDKEKDKKKDKDYEKDEKERKKEKEYAALAYGGYSAGAHYEKDDKDYKKEKKDKDKDKDKSKSKDKYKSSGGRDYSEDEDSHGRTHHKSYSSGKYRSPSPPHGRKAHSPKRSPSRDYRKHSAHQYEFTYERRDGSPERSHHYRRDESPPRRRPESPPRRVLGATGGGRPHHYEDEEYDYEYVAPVRTQLPEGHHIAAMQGHLSPHLHSHSHGRSRSSSRVRNEYVEVEYAVPVPIPPPPPPPAMSEPMAGYYLVDGEEESVHVVRATYSKREQDDGYYEGQAHKGYGEGWTGGYGY